MGRGSDNTIKMNFKSKLPVYRNILFSKSETPNPNPTHLYSEDSIRKYSFALYTHSYNKNIMYKINVIEMSHHGYRECHQQLCDIFTLSSHLRSTTRGDIISKSEVPNTKLF